MNEHDDDAGNAAVDIPADCELLTKAQTAEMFHCHPEHLMKMVRADPDFLEVVKFCDGGRVFFRKARAIARLRERIEAACARNQERRERSRNPRSPDDGCQDAGENGPSHSQGQHEGNSERESAA